MWSLDSRKEDESRWLMKNFTCISSLFFLSDQVIQTTWSISSQKAYFFLKIFIVALFSEDTEYFFRIQSSWEFWPRFLGLVNPVHTFLAALVYKDSWEMLKSHFLTGKCRRQPGLMMCGCSRNHPCPSLQLIETQAGLLAMSQDLVISNLSLIAA